MLKAYMTLSLMARADELKITLKRKFKNHDRMRRNSPAILTHPAPRGRDAPDAGAKATPTLTHIDRRRKPPQVAISSVEGTFISLSYKSLSISPFVGQGGKVNCLFVAC